MISPINAIKLAHTKFHSKRVLTYVTILVSSLLFAILILAIIVSDSVINSLSNFIHQSGGDRYLVQVNPVVPYNDISNKYFNASHATIDKIVDRQKSYEQQQEAAYKSAGLEYNQSSTSQALERADYLPKTVPDKYRVKVNMASPVIQSMIRDEMISWSNTATNKTSDMVNLAKKYDGNKFYKFGGDGFSLPPSNARLIEDNKEDVGGWFGSTGADISSKSSVETNYYRLIDDSLLNKYLNIRDNFKGVPVVLSANDIAKVFADKIGVSKTAPTDDKAKARWLSDIKAKASGLTYQVCYRNSADVALLAQAQQTTNQAADHSQDENYSSPSLIYNFPTEPCGEVAIKSDARSNQEKQNQAKTDQIAKQLGTYQAPARRMMTFEIVGVSNESYNASSSSDIKDLGSYVKKLLSPKSSLNLDGSTAAGAIPAKLYNSLSDDMKVKLDYESGSSGMDLPSEQAGQFSGGVIEFTNLDGMRRFMDDNTCDTSDGSCSKPYTAQQFGSNYLAINDLRSVLNRILSYLVPGLLGLAIVLMWLTMARLMADSRKEMAVYRAMGAKRSDIAAIYAMYVVLIALRIIVISAVGGILLSVLLNAVYGGAATSMVMSSFSMIDSNLVFSLSTMSEATIAKIVLISVVILLTCLVAGLQPIIANTMRPPIKDLKNE